jgi:hypothetical protein
MVMRVQRRDWRGQSRPPSRLFGWLAPGPCGLLCGLLCGLAPLSQAATLELTYQASNRWVAEADNAPLRALLRAAKRGTTTFQVGLPKDNRALGLARVEVLQGLLQREAKRGIIMEEYGVARRANTLWLRY